MRLLRQFEALLLSAEALTGCGNSTGYPGHRHDRSIFYKTTYDVSAWKEIPVPSKLAASGIRHTILQEPGIYHKKRFSLGDEHPSRNFTAYEERNPVGSYRRDFDIPADWKGREIFITFDGVGCRILSLDQRPKVGFTVKTAVMPLNLILRNILNRVRT